jgi:hypothetical protein
MGRPYSQDLRERVIAAADCGTGAHAAASVFRVSVSYIYKVLGRRCATGEMTARTGRAGRKPKLAAHDKALCTRVAAHPDARGVVRRGSRSDTRSRSASDVCGTGCNFSSSRSKKVTASRRTMGVRNQHGAPLRPLPARRLVSPVPWGHWKAVRLLGSPTCLNRSSSAD